MREHKTLWETRVFGFSKEESQIAPVLRDWLAKSESALGSYLAGIQYEAEVVDFSKSDVRELEKRIVKASASKAAALPSLRMFGKIVYRINHTLQLSIPQPTLAIHLTPPKSPFAFQDLALAHRSVLAWLKCEKSWLEDLQSEPNNVRRHNVPFELVVLSAALHSGILNPDLAMGLYAATMEPDKSIRHSDRLYVDLPLAWLGRPDQEIRRWYPDDGVACLIARLANFPSNAVVRQDVPYSERKRRICERVHARLSEQMRRRNVENVLLPESLGDLFDRIALFLRSELPAVMVRFATRELPTRSLLPPSIGLVYHDPAALKIEGDDSEKEERADTENEEAYGGNDPNRNLEPDWMDPIRKAFGAKGVKALKERFNQLQSDSIVAQRIVAFARSLLTHGPSSRQKPLKPNSVKCCVLTVGRRLSPLLEERDPATIREVLGDLYVRALDLAAKDSMKPEHLQGTVAWALREFHCFLIRKKLAKPVDESDVFRVARGFPPVDAMIVSVDDIYKTLDYLDYEPHASWSEENRAIAKMEVLLGFFAGLRTMEGHGAYQRHFPGGTLLPFLVLPSEERDLKTPNAVRMVPLATVMEPFEDLADEARKWVQAKPTTGAKDGDRRLFGNASDDVIGPMIGEALQTVTGNGRLRQYSLRHSFASWTLTRLLLADLPEEVPDLFPHLPLTTKWLEHSKRFRQALYGNDRVDNDHSWAGATLLGHAMPGVSYSSYCHTLDILLPEFLRNSRGLQYEFSARDRLRLSSNYDRSTGYLRLPGANGNASSSQLSPAPPNSNPVRREEQIFALNQVKKCFPAAEPVLSWPDRTWSWLDQTWGLLYMRVQPNRSFDELAHYFGLEMGKALHIVARSDEICELRSATSRQYLHSTVGVEVPVEGGALRVRYPQRPNRKAMEVAQELGNGIARLVDPAGGTSARCLDYWAHNVVPKSGSVVFSSGLKSQTKARVKGYCRLLGGLDLLQRHLRFDGACGTADEFAPTSWYGQWGLTRRESCQIINHQGKRAERIAPGQWLAVGPKESGLDREEGFDHAYRDGFRFAMLLASIRFGP